MARLDSKIAVGITYTEVRGKRSGHDVEANELNAELRNHAQDVTALGQAACSKADCELLALARYRPDADTLEARAHCRKTECPIDFVQSAGRTIINITQEVVDEKFGVEV